MAISHDKLDRKKWARIRRRVLERDGFRCQNPVCGRPGRLEVDHIKPMYDLGKAYDMGNLQALCRPCHFAKTKSENRLNFTESRPLAAAWELAIKELQNDGKAEVRNPAG